MYNSSGEIPRIPNDETLGRNSLMYMSRWTSNWNVTSRSRAPLRVSPVGVKGALG